MDLCFNLNHIIASKLKQPYNIINFNLSKKDSHYKNNIILTNFYKYSNISDIIKNITNLKIIQWFHKLFIINKEPIDFTLICENGCVKAYKWLYRKQFCLFELKNNGKPLLRGYVINDTLHTGEYLIIYPTNLKDSKFVSKFFGSYIITSDLIKIMMKNNAQIMSYFLLKHFDILETKNYDTYDINSLIVESIENKCFNISDYIMEKYKLKLSCGKQLSILESICLSGDIKIFNKYVKLVNNSGVFINYEPFESLFENKKDNIDIIKAYLNRCKLNISDIIINQQSSFIINASRAGNIKIIKFLYKIITEYINITKNIISTGDYGKCYSYCFMKTLLKNDKPNFNFCKKALNFIIKFTNHEIKTAFVYSFSSNNLSLIKWFINTFNFTKKDLVYDNNIALNYAIENNNINILKYLLDKFKFTDDDILEHGFLPFHKNVDYIMKRYSLEKIDPIPRNTTGFYNIDLHQRQT